MPQAGKPRPFLPSERLGEFRRAVGDVFQMLFQRLPVVWQFFVLAVGIVVHKLNAMIQFLSMSIKCVIEVFIEIVAK